ncbi:hypothetical protein SAMN03159297_04502 [Pseudomonas sp. NFACC45]|nr:hypothetical protein SAMN03159297_04502 [Pseudomonas sp. NFACC45]
MNRYTGSPLTTEESIAQSMSDILSTRLGTRVMRREYGSLLGGFDVGFENTGYRSSWQVELNPVNRAVLADQFSHARQFEDVRQCGAHNLSPVDVSASRLTTTLRQSSGPLRTAGMWDFDECLMLNISESPSNVVEYSWSQVIDACPPSSSWLTPRQWTQYLQRLSIQWPRPADTWAANTLLANKAGSQFALGCTTFVAHPNGWDQMAERQRAAEDDGFCLGLDAANLAEAFSAGNAVVTQVAEWVGRILNHP